MLKELHDRYIELTEKLKKISDCLDLPVKKKRLTEVEKTMSQTTFWNNSKVAQEISKERTILVNWIELFDRLTKEEEDLSILFELAEEEGEDLLPKEINSELSSLDKEIKEVELRILLNGEYDYNNAIISIHPGAGGTESQDWAEILLRMYLKWTEKKGYKTELVDYQPAEEAGIKGVTLTVSGDYAYGYLRGESGIHRLVRISPFDANKRRHTSFAAVFVYPEIDETIDVDIDEKDLRIDTYRSSGAGGQHVNVTDSAVRITHLPTKIVVQCQNERSQHKNKEKAMKILRSRLYDYYKKEQEKDFQKRSGEKAEISWGNQIRSYTMQPYQLVKDHRTKVEIGNVSAVLDGDIDRFIEAYLTMMKG
ncbi:MAG: peptide chain release factor 2 [bacterium]